MKENYQLGPWHIEPPESVAPGEIVAWRDQHLPYGAVVRRAAVTAPILGLSTQWMASGPRLNGALSWMEAGTAVDTDQAMNTADLYLAPGHWRHSGFNRWTLEHESGLALIIHFVIHSESSTSAEDPVPDRWRASWLVYTPGGRFVQEVTGPEAPNANELRAKAKSYADLEAIAMSKTPSEIQTQSGMSVQLLCGVRDAVRAGDVVGAVQSLHVYLDWIDEYGSALDQLSATETRRLLRQHGAVPRVETLLMQAEGGVGRGDMLLLEYETKPPREGHKFIKYIGWC